MNMGSSASMSFLRKNHTFSPHVRGTKRWEVEVWINSVPKSDEDVHTAQNHHFHAQTLPEPGVKEVVA
jgi:hypothetical protein